MFFKIGVILVFTGFGKKKQKISVLGFVYGRVAGSLWLFAGSLWSFAGDLWSLLAGLWLFAGGLWLFAGDLWLFAGGFWSFVVVCGRCLF